MQSFHATSKLRKKKRRKSVISLTSLIDVVFILLVFFMLATKFEQEAFISVTPPKEQITSTTHAPETPPKETIYLQLMENQTFQIGTEILSKEALIDQFTKKTEASFIISVSLNATTQDIVSFMDLTDQHNIKNYHFDFSDKN